MDDEKITITSALLDTMVAALATLPYGQVQPIFRAMADELEAQTQPKIVIN